jgi:hypothetical protein
VGASTETVVLHLPVTNGLGLRNHQSITGAHVFFIRRFCQIHHQTQPTRPARLSDPIAPATLMVPSPTATPTSYLQPFNNPLPQPSNRASNHRFLLTQKYGFHLTNQKYPPPPTPIIRSTPMHYSHHHHRHVITYLTFSIST